MLILLFPDNRKHLAANKMCSYNYKCTWNYDECAPCSPRAGSCEDSVILGLEGRSPLEFLHTPQIVQQPKQQRGEALVARGAVNAKDVNEERGSAEPGSDKQNQTKLD